MSWRAAGFRAWLWQRLTAVFMLVYLLWFAVAVAVSSPQGYFEWRQFMGGPAVATSTALFFGALLLHAWVGIRDVLIDYVKPAVVRLGMLTLLLLSLLAMGFWALRITLGVL